MSTSQKTESRRTQLNIWLASRNLSRKDLADMCSVAESTVYGWLSNTNISDKRWEFISSLFEEKTEEQAKTAETGETFRAVALLFTNEQLAEIKALAGDVPVEEFIRESTLAMTRRILNKE